MIIDWNAFTPWLSLAGGLFIGLAAAVFVLFNGRIAGISGVMGGLLRAIDGDRSWRIAFLFGLIVTPGLFMLMGHRPEVSIDASVTTLIVGGLLVGIGTRVGAGCTSGHGVCGLSRFSLRSLVATLCFMGAGFLTVFVVRHVVA